MSNTDSSTQLSPSWDEAKCTASLARLERLQAQLDDLRLAIPRIVEPFHRPTNPTTFNLYSQGVIKSQNGIKGLNDSWKSPEIQSIFEHVKRSLDANPDLTESATIPSRGWVSREQGQRETNIQENRREHSEGSSTILTDEDVSQIVLDFQKSYPDIKLDTQDNNHQISTQFVCSSTLTKFRVTIERDANAHVKLGAECLGTREPFLGISRCISSRLQANDLKNLLDMIAAYKTVKDTSCAKCGAYLDKSMLSTTARRSRKVSGVNGTEEVVWQAFHEGCLE